MNSPFLGKHGPLLIAEIGGNHEGDFEYAKKLTQLAIESDVDYVKFQIYTGDKLVSKVVSPDRNSHFKKFELSKSQHLELAKMVLDAGIKYTSSVWDIDSIKWIDDYISIYKIGSGDLTAFPVLKRTAAKNKPIIISTGLSTEEEILETIEYIQSINPIFKSPKMLAILQCTSMYPISPSDSNLNVIPRLKEITNLTVGYSDHTEGSKALEYAVALGAEVLEFHFTDSRENKVFRDHKVSLTKDEVLKLIEEIKLINQYKGNSIKKPEQIEIENGHITSFRRAVYPSKNILKGELITEDNITVLRPNIGIDARLFDSLIGKRANKNLEIHQKLNLEDFE